MLGLFGGCSQSYSVVVNIREARTSTRSYSNAGLVSTCGSIRRGKELVPVYGQIHSANRSRLSHSVADKLVFCHETIHTQMRVQQAGWRPDVVVWESRPDVVVWESDDDSDDGENEDDWLHDEDACPSREKVQQLLV